MKANTALKAEHLFACGNSGTGKSANIKEKLKTAPRVIIFDPDDEYSELNGVLRIDKPTQLVQMLRANPKGALKVAFVAEGQKAFEFFSDCAFAWRNCLAIAEEIADVTTPSKAPPSWGRLLRRGRKYGITVCAVTQRPAEADKTALTQSAFIRTGALGRNADREAIAKEINLPVKEISVLKPLDWIEFDRANLTLTKGRLGEKQVLCYDENEKQFSRSRPVSMKAETEPKAKPKAKTKAKTTKKTK